MMSCPTMSARRGPQDRVALRETLSQLRLRELLVEVQDRVEQIVQRAATGWMAWSRPCWW